jgi:hypothetical protein
VSQCQPPSIDTTTCALGPSLQVKSRPIYGAWCVVPVQCCRYYRMQNATRRAA